MKADSIAFGVAGILFGLIAGWVIGSQQAATPSSAPGQAAAASRPADSASSGAPAAAVLDETKVNAAKAVAEREPSSAAARVQVANLYFDAERYDDAIKWYAEALKLNPK